MTSIDTVLASGDTLVGLLVDLDVGPHGKLYALDYAEARVLVIEQDRVARVLVGKEGQGPGEFDSPRAIQITEDTLRVIDAGNGRVQIFTLDGVLRRTYQVPADIGAANVALGPDGYLAAATLGLSDSALAILIDPGGRPTARLGTPAVPSSGGWDIAAMKDEVNRGRVPAALRNTVLPVIDGRRNVWLLFLADGAFHRYDSLGRRTISTSPRISQLDQITSAFFDRNRADRRPFAFYPLAFFTDATVVGNQLWALMNLPDSVPSTIIVLSDGGRLTRRITLPTVHGARRFAVDPSGSEIYLALSTSAVVKVSLEKTSS